jgi:transketolase
MNDEAFESELASKAKFIAQNARISIVRMTNKANASHVGSALSVVDILACLYSGEFSLTPNKESEDVVILSKGHAATALYAVLAEVGFFPKNWLTQYCDDESPLGGHVTSSKVPGVSLSTGSLGHGLPYALGISFGKKHAMSPGIVFAVISDGECDEGTTWESALMANHFNLSNLCVIIDRNRIQSLGSTEDTIRLEPLADKWVAFGWDVVEIDGHSHVDLLAALRPGIKPRVIIANTVKGKGVSFMENSVAWHYKSPTGDYFNQALSELGVNE